MVLSHHAASVDVPDVPDVPAGSDSIVEHNDPTGPKQDANVAGLVRGQLAPQLPAPLNMYTQFRPKSKCKLWRIVMYTYSPEQLPHTSVSAAQRAYVCSMTYSGSVMSNVVQV